MRFLFFYFKGNGGGHVQSLILATMMIIIGFQTFVTGLQADIISANRKILEDVQFRVKKLEFGLLDPDGNAAANNINVCNRAEGETGINVKRAKD